MPEAFDFAKEQKELIRKELRPVLYEEGFVLSNPTSYVRERNGLLQKFYFKVQTDRLRPWVSCRPVFDARDIVSFGTDSIVTSDDSSPYNGFGWVTLENWYIEDPAYKYKIFTGKFIPRFEKLKSSIINGILPELNTIHSLDELIDLYQNDGLLFTRRLQSHTKSYYDFTYSVWSSRGRERMEIIINEMYNWDLRNLPKVVREYLETYADRIRSDEDADTVFDEYCNKVRLANKLK